MAPQLGTGNAPHPGRAASAGGWPIQVRCQERRRSVRITEHDVKLGTLYIDAPAARHTLRCVQFAYDDRHSTVVLVSVAGPQTAAKSFAAALNENCKLTVNVDGFEIQLADGTTEPAERWRDFER